jgi:hypothetical protein
VGRQTWTSNNRRLWDLGSRGRGQVIAWWTPESRDPLPVPISVRWSVRRLPDTARSSP